MPGGIFYDYWRSSAGWRVRIGLALKGLGVADAGVDDPGVDDAGNAAFSRVTINLLPAVSEQRGDAFRAVNPQSRVPALVLSQPSPAVLVQSMAILEWLDEVYPLPAFLPTDPQDRAAARAFALTIACDIHPLNNVSALGQLRRRFDADEAAVTDWCQHWIGTGFAALEEFLDRRHWRSGFIFGAAPGLAEICLIPQLYNARRVHLDLAPFPLLCAIEATCLALPAFADSAPHCQSDAPPS